MQAACSHDGRVEKLILIFLAEESSCVDWWFWSRITGTEWWNYISMQAWDDNQWTQNFYLPRAVLRACRSPAVPRYAVETVQKWVTLAI